jgi:hypothetical protein
MSASIYPRGVRGAPLTNRLITTRLNTLQDDHVICAIPSAAGPVQAHLRKSAVKSLLAEAGLDAPAICRYYVRDGIWYVTPVAAVTPVPRNRIRREP